MKLSQFRSSPTIRQVSKAHLKHLIGFYSLSDNEVAKSFIKECQQELERRSKEKEQNHARHTSTTLDS